MARRLRLGRWAGLHHETLIKRMMRMQLNEQNIRNLEPDILLLRALIEDFIERYDLFSEALVAWYADGRANTKPRKILDIADAGRLIDMASKLVLRQHQIEQTGSISMEAFHRVIELMGMAVATTVKNNTMLAEIESKWGSITIDNRASDSLPEPDAAIEGEVDDDH